jgi:hypothetical protein
MIVLLEMAGKPLRWILLCLIPLVNIVISLLMYISLGLWGRAVPARARGIAPDQPSRYGAR